MTVYICQASHDEIGRYKGGTAGNQNTELNRREWWDNGWISCIRINNAQNASRCASAAEAAVSNRNIGYDQNERNTLLPLAEACGWNLAKISTACECDCTSLASVCLIAGGVPKDAMFKSGNLAYTGNIVSRAEASGLVSVFSTSDYLRSSALLRAGDVLVSSGHAVIVTSGGTSNTSSSASSSDIDVLARDVIAGKYGNGDARRTALGDKYAAVQARVNEILSGSTSSTAVSSSANTTIKAGTYKVVASKLNVRSKPSLAGEVVASYSRGSQINGIAADTTVANGYIWAHYVARSGKTRYVALGKADGSAVYLVKV